MAIAEAAAHPQASVEEFWALPEGPPHYEYERGDLIPMTRPHSRHNRAAARLFGLLDGHVTASGAGLVFIDSLVHILPDVAYAPDLFFIAKEGKAAHDEVTGRARGAPDLVVEVLSPLGGVSRDRLTKFEVYRQAGVEWYGIVDPMELTVEEYHLVEGSYVRSASVEAGAVFRPGIFPELEVDLRALLGSD